MCILPPTVSDCVHTQACSGPGGAAAGADLGGGSKYSNVMWKPPLMCERQSTVTLFKSVLTQYQRNGLGTG